MRKINKSNPPNALTLYYSQFQKNTWENFYHYNSGSDYKVIKNLILTDQAYLCAYCEVSLNSIGDHRRRVEHFHPKRDRSGVVNWGLAWSNLLGVCLGGTYSSGDGVAQFPLPANLSCDSAKDRNHKVGNPEGIILNPLEMMKFPSLFQLDKLNCFLEPCTEGCERYAPKNNIFDSTIKLVENTINVLNLNCSRLSEARKGVLKYYNQKAAAAAKVRDKYYKAKLADEWFGRGVTSLFTTKRLLLGEEAEKVIRGEDRS